MVKTEAAGEVALPKRAALSIPACGGGGAKTPAWPLGGGVVACGCFDSAVGCCSGDEARMWLEAPDKELALLNW